MKFFMMLDQSSKEIMIQEKYGVGDLTIKEWREKGRIE